nr:TnsD family Tn7-like transposition protein [uncultured Pseudomonas sp.]
MELKFHFFPTAFPDETLHSVLSRYARLCGGSSRKAAFAGERAAASFTQNIAFPNRLADLVEALPRGTNLSVGQIIKRHTVVPYYAPFLTKDQLRHALVSMAGDGKGLMLKLGVNASRLGGASRVRFCPLCLNEDINRVGAAYWHRVHQLPGVLVCPHHKQMLRVVDPGWSSRNSRQLSLPDDGGVQEHSAQLDAALGTIAGLHQIAVTSLQLLNTELPSLSASGVRSCFLHAAQDLGLASGSHRLDLHRLAVHMGSFFKTLPAAGEFSILGDAPADIPAIWVTKLLRKPRGSHHPLKYIVLAGALKVDLVSILSRDSPLETEGRDESPGAVLIDRGASIKPAFEWEDKRPNDIWTLALSGADARAIASALKVSQVSIYRSIRAIKGGPAAWKHARFIMTRDHRRKAFEADYRSLKAHDCEGYAWLHRCDHDWLSRYIAEHGCSHSCRAHRGDEFAVLDERLARQIIECAAGLRALPGKPVRISRSRIGREMNVLSRFEKQLSKLPLCAAALAESCEPSNEFHARRLQWAEAKLRSEGRALTRSALYHTASIRPAN